MIWKRIDQYELSGLAVHYRNLSVESDMTKDKLPEAVKIRVTKDGYVCLTDIYNGVKQIMPVNSSLSPWHWKTSTSTQKEIKNLQDEGFLHHDDIGIVASRKGTFVHPLLALHYAAWFERKKEIGLEQHVSSFLDSAGVFENVKQESNHDFPVVAEMGQDTEGNESVIPPIAGTFFDPSELIATIIESVNMTEATRVDVVNKLVEAGTGVRLNLVPLNEQTVH